MMLKKKLLNLPLHRDQRGQLFVTSLIILALGVFMIMPLLDLMSTNFRASTIYEDKRDQTYAADAGVEHAIHKIKEGLPPIPDLQDDGHQDTDTYTLSSINGYPVNVTIQKIPLVMDLLGTGEYKAGQPHEDWISFSPPPGGNRNPGQGWVTYDCRIDFNFTGSGNRQIENVGAFFIRYPGTPGLIVPPYNVTGTGQITTDFLESTEVKITSGGFAFIWRWQNNKGPVFDSAHQIGTLNYTLKVLNADWAIEKYYAFATIKSQDVSYVTNFDASKWLITAQAGGTQVNAQVVQEVGGDTSITAWQINPP